MNENGEPAKDNPFKQYPFVYSYGHRNPQGLAVSSTGIIYQHEHGPQGGDEVNVIQSGKNLWVANNHIRSGLQRRLRVPLHRNGRHDTASPRLDAFYRTLRSGHLEGDLFPEWQGDLFCGRSQQSASSD